MRTAMAASTAMKTPSLSCGLGLVCLHWFAGAALACPIDPSAPAGTLLSIKTQTTQPPIQRLGAAELQALPQTQRAQRRTVNAGSDATQPSVEQSVQYQGVLLRDVLAASLPQDQRRAARSWVFEAVATDGYRAYFAWGELFNSSAGEQVLVIRAQDGQPLSAEQGPLALRALADLRPGPRHVRNLCGVVLHDMTP
jgi:hypothetical protein